MEEEDNIIVKWAQEDVETSYNLLNNNLLTYLPTYLEKLTGLQLVKKFPAFYGTQSFFTVFISACHLSLS